MPLSRHTVPRPCRPSSALPLGPLAISHSCFLPCSLHLEFRCVDFKAKDMWDIITLQACELKFQSSTENSRRNSLPGPRKALNPPPLGSPPPCNHCSGDGGEILWVVLKATCRPCTHKGRNQLAPSTPGLGHTCGWGSGCAELCWPLDLPLFSLSPHPWPSGLTQAPRTPRCLHPESVWRLTAPKPSLTRGPQDLRARLLEQRTTNWGVTGATPPLCVLSSSGGRSLRSRCRQVAPLGLRGRTPHLSGAGGHVAVAGTGQAREPRALGLCVWGLSSPEDGVTRLPPRTVSAPLGWAGSWRPLGCELLHPVAYFGC